MKRILDEACSYPWHFIDASIYDQVLNWYVSTSDPLFVIQPYMERFETTQSSNDALVFRYLHYLLFIILKKLNFPVFQIAPSC